MAVILGGMSDLKPEYVEACRRQVVLPEIVFEIETIGKLTENLLTSQVTPTSSNIMNLLEGDGL